MTYAELKTNIANYLNRSDLTDVIDSFIDSTEAEFNRRLRVKGMIKRATATLTGQYLAVPTDWLALFQQSIESMDVYRKANDNVTGQPIYFALVDDSIEFAPTPDGSYTVQLT